MIPLDAGGVFLGILALGALIAVAYGIQRLMARGSAALAGAVTGNTRTRGQAAVKRQTDFTAPVSNSKLLDRIQETLQLGQPTANGLTLAESADDGSAITITQGNTFKTQLRFVILADPTAEGCAGLATTTHWLETEGRVNAAENIERLHRHVCAAVEHFGGNHTESVNT